MSIDWKITPGDVKIARAFAEEEKIDPLNRDNMFRGGLYCILSAGENYRKLVAVHTGLLQEGLDNPDAIRKNRRALRTILNDTRFPNAKLERVYDFAGWWPTTDLPERIIKDAASGMKKEFDLRHEMKLRAPGLGYKCSSLFLRMCGYGNVVPVDLWVLRYLQDQGHRVRVSDFKTVSGHTKTEYLQYEGWLSEKAREQDIPPGLFQLALWCKLATPG